VAETQTHNITVCTVPHGYRIKILETEHILSQSIPAHAAKTNVIYKTS